MERNSDKRGEQIERRGERRQKMQSSVEGWGENERKVIRNGEDIEEKIWVLLFPDPHWAAPAASRAPLPPSHPSSLPRVPRSATQPPLQSVWATLCSTALHFGNNPTSATPCQHCNDITSEAQASPVFKAVLADKASWHTNSLNGLIGTHKAQQSKSLSRFSCVSL